MATPSQVVPLPDDCVFKFRSLWGPFLLKPPEYVTYCSLSAVGFIMMINTITGAHTFSLLVEKNTFSLLVSHFH